MLGWIGKWASSKGMGRIPSLGGLSRSNARTAITTAGFNLGTETALGNSEGATAQNDGTVKERSDVNELLTYEETLGFEYYVYSGVTPFFPPSFTTPFFPPSFTTPPFFPPSFTTPFFPPSFTTPFFPPAFQVPTCGDCVEYNFTQPTCNGEDVYVGNYTKTRKECPVGSGNWVDCTSAVFVSYGACIATNVSSCGGSGGDGTSPCVTPPFFPPSFTTPFFPPSFTTQSSYKASFCGDGAPQQWQSNISCADALAQAQGNFTTITSWVCAYGTSFPAAPTTCSTTPFFPPSFTTPFFPPTFSNICSDPSVLNQSQCSGCGYYWSVNFGECSATPWPTTPFFPPSFTTPFFPPSFTTPFFPPSFTATPFFPPTFAPGCNCDFITNSSCCSACGGIWIAGGCAI